MRLPSITFEIGAGGFRSFDRRLALQCGVTSMPIVIALERGQLRLQIRCRPEQQLIQTFTSYCADQSFDERMGPWGIWDCFDFRDTEDAEICLPLIIPIQRVVV